MSLWRGFVVLCFTLVGAVGVQGASLQPDHIAAIEATAEAERLHQGLVGLAIGLVKDGNVVYVGGFGKADLDANIAVTSRTMFRWASVAKPLTAVLAMQLVEEGRLALDDDISDIYPAFPRKPEVPVTVRHLLQHQGGIPHYGEFPWLLELARHYPDAASVPFDADKSAAVVADANLLHVPGARHHYTTFGYNLLGAVVQAAAGEDYLDLVERTVMQPLGMTSLRPDYEWEDVPSRATGYRGTAASPRPSAQGDVSWKTPGGGFHSTVEDMTRFVAGLLRRDLVSEATSVAMWTPQTLANGDRRDYGLGFAIADFNLTNREDWRVAHSGAQEKTRTLIRLYPYRGIGVAIMTNSEWARPSRIGHALLDVLEHPPTPPPMPSVLMAGYGDTDLDAVQGGWISFLALASGVSDVYLNYNGVVALGTLEQEAPGSAVWLWDVSLGPAMSPPGQHFFTLEPRSPGGDLGVPWPSLTVQP